MKLDELLYVTKVTFLHNRMNVNVYFTLSNTNTHNNLLNVVYLYDLVGPCSP